MDRQISRGGKAITGREDRAAFVRTGHGKPLAYPWPPHLPVAAVPGLGPSMLRAPLVGAGKKTGLGFSRRGPTTSAVDVRAAGSIFRKMFHPVSISTSSEKHGIHLGHEGE